MKKKNFASKLISNIMRNLQVKKKKRFNYLYVCVCACVCGCAGDVIESARDTLCLLVSLYLSLTMFIITLTDRPAKPLTNPKSKL